MGFESGINCIITVHISRIYNIIGDTKLKFGVIEIPADGIVKGPGTMLDYLGAIILKGNHILLRYQQITQLLIAIEIYLIPLFERHLGLYYPSLMF